MALSVAVALSGLSPTNFKEEGLETIYTPGARLLQSLSESSTDSSTRTSRKSGFPSDSVFARAFQLLSKLYDLQPDDDVVPSSYQKTNLLEEIIDERGETPVNEENEEKDEEKPPKELTVMYCGRDILDLGTNIQFKWDYQPAVIPPGVQNFLNNRSPLSRVDGQEMPECQIIECPISGCEFLEHRFY